MGRTPLTTQLGFISAVPKVDVTSDLPNIRCPTLVITTQDNLLYPLEKIKSWQTRIPRSELFIVPGQPYHVAATAAGECARATLEFITRGRE
jgi:3-oxoadipate enol-lactonase